ncbi:MAG: mycothiol synthase [Actinomycetota bacterium]
MTSISRVDPDQFQQSDAAGTDSVASALRAVSAHAAETDGRSPVNEATELSLRHDGLAGKSLWVARAEAGETVGFALLSGIDESASVEANLVVAPGARRAGIGRALAEAALATVEGRAVTAWSHGNHPAGSRLAEALGFRRVRDLWVMRRPLTDDRPLPELNGAGGTVVRPFEPGRDEEAFLALNAAAFAQHPEQGSMTRADLEQRMAEPWFDPAGFFVAEDAETGRMLGFHWTKVHDDRVGEVYVVGISPDAQGRGLGRLLTLTGLHHLGDRGLAEVILYVEADNAPAVAVYSKLGFTHAPEDTDVMYARD